MSPKEQFSRLYEQIDSVRSRDRHRLRQQLRKIERRALRAQPHARDLEKITKEFERSIAWVAARLSLTSDISIPEALPISAHSEEISRLLESNQVVVIAGETGSGKTTQLPKICLQMGRGVKGVIAHTQPRRVAARTVAARIAEELNSSLGERVGYQIRFNDQSSDSTQVKLMTDGILLAEIQRDRFLSSYDTIIIDEAHERSLNIDFLLGYLRQLLPKRPDLKLIITSATIDVERFSKHFSNAPIVEVSGRTFPVSIHYSEPEELEGDFSEQIVSKVSEIVSGDLPRGDTLVFLPGERDIREAALALRRAQIPHLEVLPLYARLSIAEQNKIFSTAQRSRGVRVVLATNVAETSLTVPGIRYVIDTGVARISRYSVRTKVQRLPIEPISQASANQRAGRCGRVAAGICFRLYTEEDFNSRSEFTDPEILRTNLASVILQMLYLGLGDISDFPFVEPPQAKQINDGANLLAELELVDSKRELTDIGKTVAHMPLDPRLARILYAAQLNGCLRELLIIVSALSVQDPRERPADKQTQADQAHAVFRGENSDFLSWINLWDQFEEQRQELSNRKLRDWCKSNYLHWMRMREWRDIHRQLRLLLRDLNWKENKQAASYPLLHQSLLVGFLSNIGFRDSESKEYTGLRNRKFSLFPGSALRKQPPKWVMAAELLETQKLYAHTAAQIQPDWVAKAAQHLLKREYYAPSYNRKRGQVVAKEKLIFQGLVVADGRRVNYTRIEPKICHQVFVREALANWKYEGVGKFFEHNRELVDKLLELEERTRRRDLHTDEEQLYRFYSDKIPETVVDLKSFERWRREQEQKSPKLLYIESSALEQESSMEAQFPSQVEWQGVAYNVSYSFQPGKESDGVIVEIPVELLHQVPRYAPEWLVPGLLKEKCIALARSLPKRYRRAMVPIPETIERIYSRLQPCDEPLVRHLGRALLRHTNEEIPESEWQQEEIDPLYRIYFQLVDSQGKRIDGGRNLQELKNNYRAQAQQALDEALTEQSGSTEKDQVQPATPARSGIVKWDFGKLEQAFDIEQGSGHRIRTWPALIDKGDSVSLELNNNPNQAELLTQYGVSRLALIALKPSVSYLKKELFKGRDLLIGKLGYSNRKQFVDQLLMAAVRSELEAMGLPRSEDQFNYSVEQIRPNLVDSAILLERALSDSLGLRAEINSQLNELQEAVYSVAKTAIEVQLEQLFSEVFLQKFPSEMILQYPRYLKAMQKRIERLQGGIDRDSASQDEIDQLLSKFQVVKEMVPEEFEPLISEIASLQESLEELRISLFAQPMKTRFKVSRKSVETALAKLQAQLQELDLHS